MGQVCCTNKEGTDAQEISRSALVDQVGQVVGGIASNIRGSRKPVTDKVQRSTGASRTEPRSIDWSKSDASKWRFEEIEYGGSYSYSTEPQEEEVKGKIAEGIAKVKAEPASYDGMYYQSDMTSWPEDQQKYTIIKRTGSGFAVKPVAGGGWTWLHAKYQVLTPAAEVKIVPDEFTDSAKYGGYKLSETQLPGRGMGCADVPNLKIIGDVDPNDIHQGGVGDCWLLSAISALAEFDGAVTKLFKKTPNLAKCPKDGPNQYVVTLYDLQTWAPVDITIDERLMSSTDGKAHLLGAQPSVDGELWPCYLEKAVAAHCGGWDAINGGQCTHAWMILTGCKDCYLFEDDHGKGFGCYGKVNANTGTLEDLHQNPRKSFQGSWPMKWPAVGGGGDMDYRASKDEMFERLCYWDDNNYILGCGTKSGSDTQTTDGIVDGHAYTILTCINNAGGTEFDLIKVRNPWGRGEFTSGMWDDDGPGWKNYPKVKEACKPVSADDGVFWVSKEEFFKYFFTIYLCAKDMSEFIQ